MLKILLIWVICDDLVGLSRGRHYQEHRLNELGTIEIILLLVVNGVAESGESTTLLFGIVFTSTTHTISFFGSGRPITAAARFSSGSGWSLSTTRAFSTIYPASSFGFLSFV